MTGDDLAAAGIEKATEAHPQEFNSLKHALFAVARRLPALVADDVVTEYLRDHGCLPPHRASLMGAVFKAAKAAQVIAGTGSYQKSRREECHGRVIQIWKSLEYGKARAE